MKPWSRGSAALAALLLCCAAGWLWTRLPAEEAAPADAAAPVPAEGPKYVALTFDDGPKGRITERLLDGLAQRGVKASFFLIGTLAEEYPDLVGRMAAEGHQIGIHTYDHLGPLTGLSQAGFEAQVGRSRAVLRDILGWEDYMLRPPYGSVDDNVRRWAGSPLIFWSVDPEDWDDRDVSREVAAVVSDVSDGDVILMHDIFPESVDAALQIVDQLHQEGFYFLTVQQLFEQKGIPLEDGRCYYSAAS